MEKATDVTIGRLIKVLETAPDVYEDFAFCTAHMIVDLNLVRDFLEFHEENPEATTEDILFYLVEMADLRPLPKA